MAQLTAQYMTYVEIMRAQHSNSPPSTCFHGGASRDQVAYVVPRPRAEVAEEVDLVQNSFGGCSKRANEKAAKTLNELPQLGRDFTWCVRVEDTVSVRRQA